jgi:hypothetical protein
MLKLQVVSYCMWFKNFHILVAAGFKILLNLIAVRNLSRKAYYLSGSYPETMEKEEPC